MADQNKSDSDDAKAVEKILAVVVKKRKTIPTMCLDLMKEAATYELLRLDKVEIVIDKDKKKENIKQAFHRIVHETNGLKSINISLDDLKEAKQKLNRHRKRTSEIKNYLERRKKYMKQV